jgi:hypothetical protein
MGIENYYDDKYKDYGQRCHNNRGSYQGFVKSYNLSYILDKIKQNRDLKILAGIIGVISFAIILSLLIILIPLVVKLVNFISQLGIQGVVDNVSGFLGKIWKAVGAY